MEFRFCTEKNRVTDLVFRNRIKKGYLFAFLILRIGRLLLALFRQFLFQTAFPFTMQHWFVPVDAEISGNKIFIGIVICHYYNLVKGLQ